jgi:nicotinamidase-related amidase
MTAEKISFGPDFFTIDPASAALIVIDMQHGFLAPGEPYETASARDMLPAVEHVLISARRAGLPIVWTQSDHSAPYSGILLKKFPIIREDRALWRGDKSFELYADMAQPIDGEYRLVKHKYDAFFETDLDAILRNQKVETVIIVGTATNVCCESTARSAFFRDYQVVVVSDATATFDMNMHEASLATINTFFGRVMTSDDVIHELEGDLPASTR